LSVMRGIMFASCFQGFYDSCSELVGWIWYQQSIFGNVASITLLH